MTYAVEVWREPEHERWRYYVCKKKEISRFISHTIDDYDNGKYSYRIFRIIFDRHMEISYRQKMKFLKQARQ